MDIMSDLWKSCGEIISFIASISLVGVVAMTIISMIPPPPAPECLAPVPLPEVGPPSPTAFPVEWSWPIAEEAINEPKVIRPVIIRETPADAGEPMPSRQTVVGDERRPRHHWRRHHWRRW